MDAVGRLGHGRPVGGGVGLGEGDEGVEVGQAAVLVGAQSRLVGGEGQVLLADAQVAVAAVAGEVAVEQGARRDDRVRVGPGEPFGEPQVVQGAVAQAPGLDGGVGEHAVGAGVEDVVALVAGGALAHVDE
ncbi:MULTISPECIES: hypothetical protein [unclassified Streptomyces]|uniref:hypothetical protein n=1 Tax=unclassified Streptomyces TaxID=2593676 RepID=UPI001EF07147|nr:hypothetical protein [Streptomyces sp. SA3_actG]